MFPWFGACPPLSFNFHSYFMASQEAHLRGMGQYEHFVKEFKRSLSESLDTEELDPLMRRESARALVAQFEIDMRHAKVSQE